MTVIIGFNTTILYYINNITVQNNWKYLQYFYGTIIFAEESDINKYTRKMRNEIIKYRHSKYISNINLIILLKTYFNIKLRWNIVKRDKYSYSKTQFLKFKIC